MDPVTAESFKLDLKDAVWGKNQYTIQDDNVKNIIKNLQEIFAKKVPHADAEF